MARTNLKSLRIGEENINKQDCKMKIIEYNDANNITVEFIGEYGGGIVKTRYKNFQKGTVRNPYYPSVFGVGIVGNKHKTKITETSIHTKEYITWQRMLERCYDDKLKEKYNTYKDVTCCDEWIYFEIFYEWLHSQENFEKWKDMYMAPLDKDILVKHNKIYSPETCLLVPRNVNLLFIKNDACRGDLAIGVTYDSRNTIHPYIATCSKGNGKNFIIGYFKTPEEAFYAYKEYKEALIKRVADEEYALGNITERCRDAMYAYEVEITD